MTNFTSKEAEEKKEKTAGSDTKKVVVVDEKALARMYQYIQRNYGKTWLSESEEKSRNYQLCRGIHSDCSLYYTEGVLKIRSESIISSPTRRSRRIKTFMPITTSTARCGRTFRCCIRN